jgi:Rrf2 family protein
MLALAAAEPSTVTAQALADAQQLPLTFLHAILGELRRANLVYSQRGVDGGYTLARPAEQISIGDVIRVVDGSFSGVRGMPVINMRYAGAARHLGGVWLAIETAVLHVVDDVTLSDVVAGRLPEPPLKTEPPLRTEPS